MIVCSVPGEEQECKSETGGTSNERKYRKHGYDDFVDGCYLRSYVFPDDPSSEERAERLQAMLNSMEVGDSIVTTSGFYGVIIDMTEEDVIVEFGNNKNCRIPMRKQAIAEVEKAEQASA